MLTKKTMSNQKIFKSAVLERLRTSLRSGESLKNYFEPSFDVGEGDVLTSTVTVEGKPPEMKVPENDASSADLENAIELYEYYKNLDEGQASDPRFWTYLTHVDFRAYTLARWGLGGEYSKLTDEEKTSAINQVFDHWFVSGGNDRDLRRNALARLWWAVHLTVSPWEKDPEYFGDLKRDDPYFYTRELFLTQDIYQSVLERGLGRSSRILVSVLDYLATHVEFAKLRDNVRGLIKTLNLVYGVKKIIALDRAELKKLIEGIGQEVLITEQKKPQQKADQYPPEGEA